MAKENGDRRLVISINRKSLKTIAVVKKRNFYVYHPPSANIVSPYG